MFVDAEHGPLETRELLGILQSVGDKAACIVRVPEAAELPIKKALDLGAHGIIVPQVNSADQARRIVQSAKYAPIGQRGLGIARAHRYGLKVREYMQSANDDTAVIVQAEHRDAVADIDAIVRVDGVDGVLIGPYDLSASLGLPGAVDHPDVRAAIERVRTACQAVGLPLGIFGLTAEAVRPYIDNGFTMIVAGVDTVLLGNAATTLVAALRAATAPGAATTVPR